MNVQVRVSLGSTLLPVFRFCRRFSVCALFEVQSGDSLGEAGLKFDPMATSGDDTATGFLEMDRSGVRVAIVQGGVGISSCTLSVEFFMARTSTDFRGVLVVASRLPLPPGRPEPAAPLVRLVRARARHSPLLHWYTAHRHGALCIV